MTLGKERVVPTQPPNSTVLSRTALIADGFLERADGALRTTPKGRLVLNQIVRRLVDAAAAEREAEVS